MVRNTLAQLAERRFDRAVRQARPLLRNEEVSGAWKELLPPLGIVPQRLQGGRMQGNEAGLAVLAFADDQQGLVPIHIVEFQPHRFGDAQPGAGQQTDEGLPGVRAKPAPQLPGATQQMLDLGGAVEVWGSTTMGRTQQVAWRDLGSGFGQQEMLGEGTDDLQAPGPVEAIGRFGPTSLVQGQSGGQRPPVTQRIGVTGKLQKAEPFVLELETQRSAVGQIRAYPGKHGRFHGLLLGQGSATSRSSSRFTCA